MILDLTNLRVTFEHGKEIEWLMQNDKYRTFDSLLAAKIVKHYPVWYADLDSRHWKETLINDLWNCLPDDFYLWYEKPDFDEVMGTTDEQKKQPANSGKGIHHDRTKT